MLRPSLSCSRENRGDVTAIEGRDELNPERIEFLLARLGSNDRGITGSLWGHRSKAIQQFKPALNYAQQVVSHPIAGFFFA
jgi:hypothetical protein